MNGPIKLLLEIKDFQPNGILSEIKNKTNEVTSGLNNNSLQVFIDHNSLMLQKLSGLKLLCKPQDGKILSFPGNPWFFLQYINNSLHQVSILPTTFVTRI